MLAEREVHLGELSEVDASRDLRSFDHPIPLADSSHIGKKERRPTILEGSPHPFPFWPGVLDELRRFVPSRKQPCIERLAGFQGGRGKT